MGKSIKSADEERWFKEWLKGGDFFLNSAVKKEHENHIQSAQNEYLRASTYYRTALMCYTNVNDPELKKEIESLKKVIDSGNKIVAITGAGISMSAGIKDMEHLDFFSTLQMMSETMLKMNPKHYYNIVRKGFLDAAFSSHGTVTHKKLAELERNGKVTGIITTNIDCMHTLAGSVNVAEIQGSFQINKCLKCGSMYHDIELWNHGNAPKCLKCGGAICPFPVYSKVGVYDPAVRKARKWISEADVILIIGSKGMYGNTYFQNRNTHAKIVQINPKNTGFENIAMLNIHNKADEIFEHI